MMWKRIAPTAALTTFLLAAPALLGAPSADPLPSWSDTAPKAAIVEFVERVSDEGSPDFVPVEKRVAVFDNDGTLWAEQPLYFQLLFAVDRVKALAPEHPEWKTTEPFASILKGDVKAALAGGEKPILEFIAATHSGMTTEEFQKIVKQWLATARHPTTHKPYTEMVYQPMLELLEYLRASGFKTFIVSGGGVEFMRAFAEGAYGIPPEQVIGSAGKEKFEIRDGVPTIIKTPGLEFLDDKDGKPLAINRIIGRRPVMAFGNSDGDMQMLQWTTAGDGARFGLLVRHTDDQREWAYDRQSHIGTLDEALDAASGAGWVVVDMENDWNRVFPWAE